MLNSPLLALAICCFCLALVLVMLLVPIVRQLAQRYGAVQFGGKQHGQGQRMHQGAMPNIGGVAIFSGFMLAVLLALQLSPLLSSNASGLLWQIRAILLGACLMAGIGLLDDLCELPAVIRLLAQVLAAGILVLHGIKIGFITDYFGSGQYLYFGEGCAILLTVLWVVGFTNAFNFIDGLDGLSSGIATISSFALLAIAVQFDERVGAIILLSALAGAVLGFLRHNVNPASIIMGDCGAYFIGYVLAAVSVLGALKVTAVVTIATPLLVLGLPLLNITQVVLRRLKRGIHPAQASNDHLHDMLRVRLSNHHRSRPYAKRGAVLILWSFTLIFATTGMMLAHLSAEIIVLTVLVSVGMLSLMSSLRWLELRNQR